MSKARMCFIVKVCLVATVAGFHLCLSVPSSGRAAELKYSHVDSHVKRMFDTRGWINHAVNRHVDIHFRHFKPTKDLTTNNLIVVIY